MAQLHREWRECALCGTTRGRLSLHHVSKHPRSDVRANCVMLCGDGVQGEHGLVEAHDEATLRLLGEHIRVYRPDTIDYLVDKLGDVQARAWLRRNLYADV